MGHIEQLQRVESSFSRLHVIVCRVDKEVQLQAILEFGNISGSGVRDYSAGFSTVR